LSSSYFYVFYCILPISCSIELVGARTRSISMKHFFCHVRYNFEWFIHCHGSKLDIWAVMLCLFFSWYLLLWLDQMMIFQENFPEINWVTVEFSSEWNFFCISIIRSFICYVPGAYSRVQGFFGVNPPFSGLFSIF